MEGKKKRSGCRSQKLRSSLPILNRFSCWKSKDSWRNQDFSKNLNAELWVAMPPLFFVLFLINTPFFYTKRIKRKHRLVLEFRRIDSFSLNHLKP